MQLLVHINNHVEITTPLLAALLEAGVKGATVVDCKGMLTALDESSVEPPPIFGSLREFINPEHQSGKMFFMVLKDEDIRTVRETIHQVVGNLKLPNTGILFTVPVMNWEGVTHR